MAPNPFAWSTMGNAAHPLRANPRPKRRLGRGRGLVGAQSVPARPVCVVCKDGFAAHGFRLSLAA